MSGVRARIPAVTATILDGKATLAASDLKVIAGDDILDAAKKIVAEVKKAA